MRLQSKVVALLCWRKACPQQYKMQYCACVGAQLVAPLLHERDMYLAWSLKRSKAVDGTRRVMGWWARGTCAASSTPSPTLPLARGCASGGHPAATSASCHPCCMASLPPQGLS